MTPRTIPSSLSNRHDRIELLLQLATPLRADLFEAARSIWERGALTRAFLTKAKQPLVDALHNHAEIELLEDRPGTRDVLIAGRADELAQALLRVQDEFGEDFDVFENERTVRAAR